MFILFLIMDSTGYFHANLLMGVHIEKALQIQDIATTLTNNNLIHCVKKNDIKCFDALLINDLYNSRLLWCIVNSIDSILLCLLLRTLIRYSFLFPFFYINVFLVSIQYI